MGVKAILMIFVMRVIISSLNFPTYFKSFICGENGQNAQ